MHPEVADESINDAFLPKILAVAGLDIIVIAHDRVNRYNH